MQQEQEGYQEVRWALEAKVRMEEVRDRWMEVSEVTESEQGADRKL